MSDFVPAVDTSWRVWVRVTTYADRRWRDVVKRYHDSLCDNMRHTWPQSPERRRADAATKVLQAERAEYRRTVLNAYWKLLTPMAIGDVVPDEVATLLSEQWDVDTGAPS